MLPALAASLPILLAAESAATAATRAFPEIVIRKTEVASEWAFSIDEGELACVNHAGSRFVFFSEILTAEEMGEIGNMTLPRSVIVSVNPLDLLATVDNRELYLPFDTLETLIKRLAPFYAMGRALCDLPKKNL
jgi:hypothetical protein